MFFETPKFMLDVLDRLAYGFNFPADEVSVRFPQFFRPTYSSMLLASQATLCVCILLTRSAKEIISDLDRIHLHRRSRVIGAYSVQCLISGFSISLSTASGDSIRNGASSLANS